MVHSPPGVSRDACAGQGPRVRMEAGGGVPVVMHLGLRWHVFHFLIQQLFQLIWFLNNKRQILALLGISRNRLCKITVFWYVQVKRLDLNTLFEVYIWYFDISFKSIANVLKKASNLHHIISSINRENYK